MRLKVFSDLHLECADSQHDLCGADADVVILAGDIHSGTRGLEWAGRQFPGRCVIYVPGNHEFYGVSMSRLRAELRVEAERRGIILLDNRAVTVDGVRFYGTTLWADFGLYADRESWDVQATQDRACARLPDFRIIEQPEGEVFSIAECQRLHAQALAWLEHELEQPFAGKKVIVSHHAPLEACIPARFKDDALSPAFASNLGALMGKADLWVHGHVHEPVDIRVGDTRIIANPGGYPNEFTEPQFDAHLLVDL
ncbi:metallophosphoesterase [Marinobacterium rhizophilum]|uniref:Metallophosphoesterase family protein n=1 Tax=Marinobacterium rhizophilum TaxID=420402 RepID=A0ABY5HJU1_9GAMM|nr:metallophosphoesterase [Marinobacterium rhizophilum]UTW12563.1 metallophosphoesterase family protein [Marinobacterium rhizophilum]